ncbi:hypothetical protein B0T17DRAFT_620111 [Bombardia bombarda]|uniref:Uncharacterized protein n=1 Tax=Bombardia bombarda TaxID=252184 RepID=A0AA40BVK7_9PEZI|nr:hypothetical protein B0T17DRAFT_620111 [Bombardia bombarda]
MGNATSTGNGAIGTSPDMGAAQVLFPKGANVDQATMANSQPAEATEADANVATLIPKAIDQGMGEDQAHNFPGDSTPPASPTTKATQVQPSQLPADDWTPPITPQVLATEPSAPLSPFYLGSSSVTVVPPTATPTETKGLASADEATHSSTLPPPITPKRKAEDDDLKPMNTKRTKSEETNESTPPGDHSFDATAPVIKAKRKADDETDDSPVVKRVKSGHSIFGGPSSVVKTKRKLESDDVDEDITPDAKRAETQHQQTVDTTVHEMASENSNDWTLTVVPKKITFFDLPGEIRNKISDEALTVDPAAIPEKITFFSLPAEIRNQIYGYIATSHKPVVTPHSKMVTLRVKQPVPFHINPVNMMLVNKKLSGELQAYLYANNTFSLTITQHRGWLNQIGRPNASDIRTIQVYCNGKNKHADANLVYMQSTMSKRCHSLRTIIFDLHFDGATAQMLDRLITNEMAATWANRKAFKCLQEIIVTKTDIRNRPGRWRDQTEVDKYKKLAEQSGVAVKAVSKHSNRGNGCEETHWLTATYNPKTKRSTAVNPRMPKEVQAALLAADAIPTVAAPASTAPALAAPAAATAPAPTAPSLTAPDAIAPAATALADTVPAATAPATTAPSMTAPEVTAPAVSAPDVTAPGAPAV